MNHAFSFAINYSAGFMNNSLLSCWLKVIEPFRKSQFLYQIRKPFEEYHNQLYQRVRTVRGKSKKDLPINIQNTYCEINTSRLVNMYIRTHKSCLQRGLLDPSGGLGIPRQWQPGIWTSLLPGLVLTIQAHPVITNWNSLLFLFEDFFFVLDTLITLAIHIFSSLHEIFSIPVL